MQDTVKKSVLPTSDDKTQQQDYITNLDRDVFNLTQLVNNTNNIKFAGSLTSDNNTPTSVTFIGDSTAPGNSKYYGTNASGVKGFYTIASGASFKVLSFTRDMTAGNGDVSYTGFGFTPKCLSIIFELDANSGGIGFDDGTTHSSILFSGAGATFNLDTTKSILIYNSATNAGQEALVKTFDADGFTLTWNKVDTPTGTGKFTVKADK